MRHYLQKVENLFTRHTDITCCNKLRQNFEINKDDQLFVICRATVGYTVQCLGQPKLLVGQMVKS